MTEATLETNPSYIWRSLHGNLHLLKVGARRCIGSGRDVGIWNEPCLPDSLDPTMQTQPVRGLETTKVCFLVSMNKNIKKRWDSDILNDLFSARDRDLILKVLFSIKEENDGWSWHMESVGTRIEH